jgi:hypothetical protein
LKTESFDLLKKPQNIYEPQQRKIAASFSCPAHGYATSSNIRGATSGDPTADPVSRDVLQSSAVTSDSFGSDHPAVLRVVHQSFDDASR